MKTTILPLLPVLLILGLFLLVSAPDVAADPPGGGSGRVVPRSEESAGDHGGGDPDNPVPLGGAGPSIVSDVMVPVKANGSDNLDNQDFADLLWKTARELLGSLALL